MSGLFGTLNIGKSGMFAQQGAINTTSHNIANANTEGYSRQRVELQTTRPYCKPSMNSAAGPGQVGTGVQIVAINRVRDSFLDYQTRVELGVQGHFSSRHKFLSQIENILNEPTDVGISKLFGKFFDAWHDLSLNAQGSNAKKVVMEQASALADELNHTFNELSKLKENTQREIQQTVFEVNSILNQINQLNQEIVQVKVAGQQPNDLMDRRDLLLDKLSAKFGIEIDKENFEGINLSTSNHAKDYQDKTSPFGGTPPQIQGKDGKFYDANLVQRVNPEDVYRFSYIKDITPKDKQKLGGNGKYEVTYYVGGDTKSEDNKRTITVTINSEEEFKRLDEGRVLWTDKNGDVVKIPNNSSPDEKDNQSTETIKNNGSCDFTNLKLFEPPSGELKGQMSVQEEIDNYQEQLNKLAKALAFSVNAIHTQSLDPANPKDKALNFFINGENPNNEMEITAGNIALNKAIKENPMKIIAGVTPNSGEGDGKRALAISQIKDVFMSIQDIKKDTDRKKFLEKFFAPNDEFQFNGITLDTIGKDTNGMTMNTYFNDIIGGLGVDEAEAKRMVKNQATLLAGFQQSRDSVSGVSLDEEFANLVQFNHCYQANAKIISTVDQLLDVVINGLKK
ncbi:MULTISPECIES: flagellar hook-associated protein FlgK [Clostridium]|uniref:Flagellar hook-associated protein 1 n=2 Tax=Clostridium TaxID=1485 RepID=A0AAU8Z0D0_CLOBO|nr:MULTISPECIES: flagellar hook-associated protein FlgK [Clostridium]AJD32535.1 flagellar hook-associated protein FlgK [Clostridium botulinum Prevot_594]AVP64075.1 flagellar hook-associated protein FlgK [Clostridium botulinum]MBW5456396.1 flagellar hook-associated protein FlgK [Clostridium sporogenes]MCF4016660.1 flagellar hook-associated protein FlgK [Clostridium sporogenes]MCW6122883.1 flagellar hook-associated protein FlgK [Clostridium sporogenes]